MEAGELRRVKEDLATIKKAAGLELPFGWEDVRWHLIIGASSLIGLVWALVPHPGRNVWGLMPMGALAVCYAVRKQTKYRRSSGASPTKRRQNVRGLGAATLVLAATVAYVYWAKHWHIPAWHIREAAFFWAPLGLLIYELQDRRCLLRSSGLLVAFPVAGVASAFWRHVPQEALLASVAFVGFLVSAGVMAHFLREAQRDHAAD